MNKSNKPKQQDNVPTILVVEDNKGLRRLITKNFRSAGYNIVAVDNGADAISQAIESAPDLLLIDYRLPDITGEDVVKELKRQQGQVPFITMTGHGDEIVAVKMMKLGARDYLIKDSSFLDLLPGVVQRVFNALQTEKELAAIQRERDKLKTELEHSRVMEAVGTFAGGISHDFNNILAVILGYADMAIEEVSPETTLGNSLKEIYQAANRAKQLVGQFLSCSRMTNKKCSPIYIRYVVENELNTIQQFQPANIRIEADIDHNCGAIMASYLQLQKVVANLCKNAIEAMDKKGGVLTIALKQVSKEKIGTIIETERPKSFNSYIRLTISDTGCGMNDATKKRIFDPYFTLKEISRSKGLGLAVVYGIVKSYGGVIMVESVVGKGSTFQLFFPVAETTIQDK